MRSFVAESGVEEVCLDYFADLGWQVLHGPDIAPGESRSERAIVPGCAPRGAAARRDLLAEPWTRG